MNQQLPVDALRQVASPLSDRVGLSLIVAAAPVPLSIAIGMVYGDFAGIAEPSDAAKNIMYGTSLLLTIAVTYYLLSANERAVTFRFQRPSGSELTWTLIGFPLGSAAYIGGLAIANAAGFSAGGYEYTLSDPFVIAAVVFGAVIVTPLVEEILFRGALLGSLLGRGVSPLLAGTITIVAFALIHIAILGVVGVIAIALWSIFPTYLRLRYNNLTGAWLLHFINNIWSYIGVVALGIA